MSVANPNRTRVRIRTDALAAAALSRSPLPCSAEQQTSEFSPELNATIHALGTVLVWRF